MTATRRKRPATKEVGQLRYAAVDALLPLAGALVVMLAAGLPLNLVYIAVTVGGIVALVRLTAYVGK